MELMQISLSFGTILLLGIVLYFAIKNGIKNGINESMMFSNEQRKAYELKDWEDELKELEDVYKSIGKDVPDHIKELYK